LPRTVDERKLTPLPCHVTEFEHGTHVAITTGHFRAASETCQLFLSCQTGLRRCILPV